MNRRKFLKSISSLLVAIPFLSTEKIVSGVDKAIPCGDSTGILLVSNVSHEGREVVNEYYTRDYAQSGNITCWPSSNRYNCKCSLEWTETE
jgi:hypothetical protein